MCHFLNTQITENRQIFGISGFYRQKPRANQQGGGGFVISDKPLGQTVGFLVEKVVILAIKTSKTRKAGLLLKRGKLPKLAK